MEEVKWCHHRKHLVLVTEFIRLKNGRLYSYCNGCHREKNKQRYTEHRDSHLAYRHEYRLRNRERILKQDRDARLARKIAVFNHYGNGVAACVCCGVSETEFLTLDHINANGADHRKQLKGKDRRGYATGWFIYKWLIDNHFPEGYQTLCFNCNVGKHRTGINKCPHEIACPQLLELATAARKAA